MLLAQLCAQFLIGPESFADPFAQDTINAAREHTGASQPGLSQTQSNQAASQALEESSGKNRKAAQLHAIPAAVCAAACAGQGMSGKSCTMASVGASLGTMALKKNFQDNMAQSLASLQSLQAMNQEDQESAEAFVARTRERSAQTEAASESNSTSGKEGGNSASDQTTQGPEGESASQNQTIAKKKPKRNMQACAAGAIAAMTAYSQYNSARNAQEKKQSVDREVQDLNAETELGALAFEKLNQDTARNPTSSDTQPQSVAAQATDPCASIDKKNQLDAYVQCVRGFDPTVPDVLETDAFKDDFKDLTGMNLGDFLNQVPETAAPSDIMSSLLGDHPGLQTASATALKEKFSSVEDAQYQRDYGGHASVYAGGGGGALNDDSGEAEFAEQMNTVMGNLMNQLGGGKKGTQSPFENAKELRFHQRSPGAWSQSHQDQQISLFEQVTTRYLRVRHRLSRMPWSSKVNQEKAPQQIKQK